MVIAVRDVLLRTLGALLQNPKILSSFRQDTLISSLKLPYLELPWLPQERKEERILGFWSSVGYIFMVIAVRDVLLRTLGAWRNYHKYIANTTPESQNSLFLPSGYPNFLP
jgi:hypothetical protein